MIKIARIDGDGIGKEVTEAGVAVLESLDLNIDFIEAEAGRECFDKNGTTIPEETIKIAKNTKVTLFGAITSTPGQKSPIITLRQELDTYANLRPIKSFKGINCLFDDLDFLIVRENTEGLYSGNETIEEMNGEDKKATAQRVITKKASERISKLAFEEAIKLGKESVTCVHKANVLKKTDGVFKESRAGISDQAWNKAAPAWFLCKHRRILCSVFPCRKSAWRDGTRRTQSASVANELRFVRRVPPGHGHGNMLLHGDRPL